MLVLRAMKRKGEQLLKFSVQNGHAFPIRVPCRTGIWLALARKVISGAGKVSLDNLPAVHTMYL